ncbi:porin [Roseibium sp.]|uniref:porin n=1 Tax=Roseibium sp. TaxID=1936156 RepID=UPI003A96E892
MNFKSLMLGAAAAAAATGAQAADLPVAPEPVDYVRVCDAYGARFYYIPGTETCLRVGGRVRADYATNNFADDGDWAGRTTGASFDAKGYLYLDARSNTEFGLLRAFIEYEISAANVDALGKAYIQWGGLTFGHVGSFFDFPIGQVFVNPVGRNWSDLTTELAAYTATFGNGFSATISVEDAANRNVGATNAGAMKFPDLVANVRVDQGWGSAQLSGALHNVRPTSAADEGALGWAINGGVAVNLPMVNSGAKVAFNAAYADGALAYLNVGSTATAQGVPIYDAAPNGDTSTGYAIGAGFFLPATSTVNFGVDGSYANIEAGNSTADVTHWAVNGSVEWVPVSGLQMGVGIGYSNTDLSTVAGDDETLAATFRIQRTF